MQGPVKGERRQGRQKKRQGDNIREGTGLEFAKSQRAVENREKLRKLVVNSPVVPQRPTQEMMIRQKPHLRRREVGWVIYKY